MGVDIFFVLSGYLITSLLLGELNLTGRVSLRRFYARRALRLYPALLLVIVAGVGFYRQFGDGGTLAGYGKTAALSGLYVEDFAYGWFHSPFGEFGHTWSLAVEEQFYLLWPPVLLLVARKRRDLVKFSATVTVLGWTLMIASLRRSADGIPDASYYLPWNRFSQLMIGAALAALLARRAAPRFVKSAAFGWTAIAACAALVVAAAHAQRYRHLAWEAPAIAIAASALIWHLSNETSSLRRVLSVKALAWIGRRSYGIYLIHLPVLSVLVEYVHERRLVVSALMGVVTLLLAALSYRFIELPFLRIKHRRFESQSHPPEPVPT